MGKAGALASGTGTVVVAGHVGAVAVVHGGAVNAAALGLLIAGNGGSAAAASSGTATTPPPVSPSTTSASAAAGGTSGSCVHSFSLFLFLRSYVFRPKGTF